MPIVKTSAKGQAVIPAKIRNTIGLTFSIPNIDIRALIEQQRYNLGMPVRPATFPAAARPGVVDRGLLRRHVREWRARYGARVEGCRLTSFAHLSENGCQRVKQVLRLKYPQNLQSSAYTPIP